jgi:hypothetical protein
MRSRNKDPLAREVADALDKIQKNHVENAITQADALDCADNGEENPK